MKRIACRAMFAAVAAMLMAGCHRGVAASASPIAAMNKAMAEAKSYKTTMVTGGNEVVTEVECPDKARIITTAAGTTTEMVEVGTDTYIKIGDKWMKSATAGMSASVCVATGSASAPTTESNAPAARVSKGASTTINGIACQQWTVNSDASTVTYCIGSGNYPVQMKTSSATTTYSDWNKVQVEVPKG